MPLKTVSCKVCEGEFSYEHDRRGRLLRFCSDPCWDENQKRESARWKRENKARSVEHSKKSNLKNAARNSERRQQVVGGSLCFQCGAAFPLLLNHPRAICCSRECGKAYSDKARSAAAYERNKRQCEHCSQDFIPFKKSSSQIAAGFIQRYCSKECGRAAAEPMRALRRQEEKAAREAARVVRELELEAARIARLANRKPAVEHKCQRCEGLFTPTYGDKRKNFCSRRCSKAATRTGRSGRHRARRYGVPYESVDPIKVLQRDRWRCQLCGIPTPKRLRGTFEPNAPEVDHIVTLADGGEHSYRNTQCACRACNQKKSSRSRGQMRLF